MHKIHNKIINYTNNIMTEGQLNEQNEHDEKDYE